MEHRKEKVATIPHFILRMGRYSLFAAILIVFSVGIGVIGYRYFAGLNWVDCLYMASMILTGMGPVSEMPNDAAKIFSSIYALYSGVAFLSITAVFFAPIIHRLLHILQVEQQEVEN
jgi:hypothetical protein